jgi:hypothetical protein
MKALFRSSTVAISMFACAGLVLAQAPPEPYTSLFDSAR